jgi:hypothetical protein
MNDENIIVPEVISENAKVRVVDIDIAFSRMVLLLVKFAFALIPAAIIFIVLSSWFSMMFYGIVRKG